MNNLVKSNKYVVLGKAAIFVGSISFLVGRLFFTKVVNKVAITTLIAIAVFSYMTMLSFEYLGEKLFNLVFKKQV